MHRLRLLRRKSLPTSILFIGQYLLHLSIPFLGTLFLFLSQLFGSFFSIFVRRHGRPLPFTHLKREVIFHRRLPVPTGRHRTTAFPSHQVGALHTLFQTFLLLFQVQFINFLILFFIQLQCIFQPVSLPFSHLLRIGHFGKVRPFPQQTVGR